MSAELNIGRITESLRGGPDAASELGAAREMRENGLEAPGVGTGPAREGGATFSQVLESSLSQVNEYQSQADTAIKELVAGRTKNIHETMLAIERADTSLKMAMQVRNKILDAYREIMRMQV